MAYQWLRHYRDPIRKRLFYSHGFMSQENTINYFYLPLIIYYLLK